MELNCRIFDYVNFSRDGCVPYIDVAGSEYPSVQDPVKTWEIILKAIFYVFIITIAILGNIIVLCIVFFNPTMRSTTNIYIANLATGDFFMACIPMWVYLIEGITRQWLLGEVICKIFPFIQVTSSCASVFTMTAIACDRFFAVVFPLKSRATTRNVGVIITLIWLLSIALGCPLIMGYQLRVRKWKNNYVESFCNEEFAWLLCDVNDICEFNRLQATYRRAYWTFICAIASWLPMIIMQVVYLTIAVIMYRRNRINPNHHRSSSNRSNHQTSVQQRSLKKVLRMMFIVLITFMVCWVPFQICLVYSIYRSDGNKTVQPWFHPFQYGAMMLAHANSAINPIIYAGLSENFRKGFVRVFMCWKRKDQQDRFNNTASGIVLQNATRRALLSNIANYSNGYTRNINSNDDEDEAVDGDVT